MTNMEVVQRRVADALAGLSELFAPEAKLIFVMHVPGKPGCYMVIGDDELDGAIAAIEESKKTAVNSEIYGRI